MTRPRKVSASGEGQQRGSASGRTSSSRSRSSRADSGKQADSSSMLDSASRQERPGAARRRRSRREQAGKVSGEKTATSKGRQTSANSAHSSKSTMNHGCETGRGNRAYPDDRQRAAKRTDRVAQWTSLDRRQRTGCQEVFTEGSDDDSEEEDYLASSDSDRSVCNDDTHTRKLKSDARKTREGGSGSQLSAQHAVTTQRIPVDAVTISGNDMDSERLKLPPISNATCRSMNLHAATADDAKSTRLSKEHKQTGNDYDVLDDGDFDGDDFDDINDDECRQNDHRRPGHQGCHGNKGSQGSTAPRSRIGHFANGRLGHLSRFDHHGSGSVGRSRRRGFIHGAGENRTQSSECGDGEVDGDDYGELSDCSQTDKQQQEKRLGDCFLQPVDKSQAKTDQRNQNTKQKHAKTTPRKDWPSAELGKAHQAANTLNSKAGGTLAAADIRQREDTVTGTDKRGGHKVGASKQATNGKDSALSKTSRKADQASKSSTASKNSVSENCPASSRPTVPKRHPTPSKPEGASKPITIGQPLPTSTPSMSGKPSPTTTSCNDPNKKWAASGTPEAPSKGAKSTKNVVSSKPKTSPPATGHEQTRATTCRAAAAKAPMMECTQATSAGQNRKMMKAGKSTSVVSRTSENHQEQGPGERIASTLMRGVIERFSRPRKGTRCGYGRILIEQPTAATTQNPPWTVSFIWPSASFETGGLPPEKGDKVELKVRRDDMSKAAFVHLLHCAKRNAYEVKELVSRLHKLVISTDSEVDRLLIFLSNSLALWQMLGRMGESSRLDGKLMCSLLEIVCELDKSFHYRHTSISKITHTLVRSNLLHPSGRLAMLLRSNDLDNRIGLVHDFLLCMAKSEPKSSRFLLPLFTVVAEKHVSLEQIQFLLSILNHTMPTCSETAFRMWRRVPLICIPEEVLMIDDCHLATECLMEVKKVGPYSDAETYLDVYTRLLREDCLSSLREEIIKLRRGEPVDPRDIDIFDDVRLQGICVDRQSSDCGYSLEVTLRNPRGRRNFDWEGAASLMFGNLLCLIPDQTFERFLWATVVDVLFERKGSVQSSILIEPLPTDDHAADHSLLREMLSADQGFLMVASPVYYRSYQPILKNLQSLKAKALAFQEELVEVNFQRPYPPAYMKQDDMVAFSSLLQPSCVNHCMMNTRVLPVGKKVRTALRASTLNASAVLRLDNLLERLWERGRCSHEADELVCSLDKVLDEHASDSVGEVKVKHPSDTTSNNSRAVANVDQNAQEAAISEKLPSRGKKALTTTNGLLAKMNSTATNANKTNQSSCAVCKKLSVREPTAVQPAEENLPSVQVAEEPQCDLCFELDPSQCHALAMALTNRLAVIQGPPGTGKTYIGVKLVQLLLSMKNLPKHAPIVVITYKNHCLDEFLLACMRKGVTNVARIGGGGTKELEDKSLRNLVRQLNFPSQIGRLHAEMNRLRADVEEATSAVARLDSLIVEEIPKNVFLEHAMPGQVRDLVFGYDWPDEDDYVDDGDGLDSGDGLDDGDENENMAPFQHTHIQILDEVLSNRRQTVSELLLSYQFLADHGEDEEEYCEEDEEGDEVDGAINSEDQSEDEADDGASHYFTKHDLRREIHEAVSFAWRSWLPSTKEFKKFEKIAAKTIEQKTEEIPAFSWTSTSTRADWELLEQAHEKEEREMERRALTGRSRQADQKKMVIKLTSRADMSASRSLKAVEKEDTENVLGMSSVWKMSTRQRVLFCHRLVAKHRDHRQRQLEHALEEYSSACRRLKDEQQTQDLLALRKTRLAGMTVTGASINYNLLMRLKPAVVIVEEAAEVLEAQLIPLLGCGLEHLVLIGDHQQLRPQVENYELVMTYNMDVSMMERMMKNRIPHGRLDMQSRMHPEIGDLLLDIYPDLRHNMAVVSKRHLAAPPSLQNFLFFWHHESPEQAARSYTNPEEAQRVVRLVRYLIYQGCQPESITVLAAYRGQMGLLRRKLRETLPSDSEKNKLVTVTTIDRYQGDENDIVVISLVRSNDHRGKAGLGFLNIVNRCTVAQSRARSAMYMVGNANTLRRAPHWRNLLWKLEKCGRVGETLLLSCPRHRGVIVPASSGTDIQVGTSFCKQPCSLPMHCEHEEHRCPRTCQPPHSHLEEEHPCKALVTITCSGCSKDNKWPCSLTLSNRRCQQEVSVTCDRCSKATTWRCVEVTEGRAICRLQLKKTCSSCGGVNSWPCDKSETARCYLPVKEVCATCQRENTFKCCEAETSMCRLPVNVKCETCGRENEFQCSKARTSVCCLPVEKTCEKCNGVSKHPCYAVQEANCLLNVDVSCEKCHSVMKKTCSAQTKPRCQQVTVEKCPDCGCVNRWPCGMSNDARACRQVVTFRRSDCHHFARRLCSESESSCQPCKEPVEWCCQRCGTVKKGVACHNSIRFHCTARVNFTCPDCYGRKRIKCMQMGKTFKCTRPVRVFCKVCRRPSNQLCHKKNDMLMCKRKIYFKMKPCGHKCSRRCSQSLSEVHCGAPCPNSLRCGHPCDMKCGEPCNNETCSRCEKIEEEKQKLLRKEKERAFKEEIEATLEKLKEQGEGEVIREDLLEGNDEYLTVKDMVEKYVQPAHNWVPVIKRIERTLNNELSKRFCKTRLRLHDLTRTPERKFHGTSHEAIESIVAEGFHLPTKPGMFGKGIYFATDSSKSAQYSGKASGQLLVCEVLLGKVYNAKEADPRITYESLRQKGFDSVFAPRNTRQPQQHGVLFDEYVVYNPDQALPKYIVHFEGHQLSQNI